MTGYRDKLAAYLLWDESQPRDDQGRFASTGGSYAPSHDAPEKGDWDRSGPEPRWHQQHRALVGDALVSWVGDPGNLSLHMQDARAGAPVPSSGTGKQMRAQAEALMWELDHHAKLNPMPLYRGSGPKGDRPSDRGRGMYSWSEDRKIATVFAKRYGGKVAMFPAGSVRGLRLRDYAGDSFGEKQWVVRAGNDPVVLSDADDDAIINLPDISDVSFPSMVGAIPSKPPTKRKRTRTLYKGVSLSRRPMKFEAKVLSLTEIPRRLDACRDTLAISDDDTCWRETMHTLAAYGASEVLMELVRQGAPTRLAVREVPVDVEAICAAVLADRSRALTSLREDYEARLRRRRIRADRREALTQSFTDVRRPSLLKRFANRATNEAFALGRTTAMHLLQRQRIPVEFELAYHGEDGKFISKAEAVAGGEAIVDAVIQTAVMDTGTCDECAEVDGESMELGSDRQEELRPPYVKCRGGDACRCIQIALLSDGSEIDVDEIDEDTLHDHESDKPSHTNDEGDSGD